MTLELLNAALGIVTGLMAYSVLSAPPEKVHAAGLSDRDRSLLLVALFTVASVFVLNVLYMELGRVS